MQEASHRSSYQQVRQYTYFDNITKKYLEQKRKNLIKQQQNKIDQQRKQLAYCTFKPAIHSSKTYIEINRKMNKLKQDIRGPKDKQQSHKDQPYQRLLNWGTKKEINQRHKLIQKQLETISLTKSLSKSKRTYESKLNRSLEQYTRSPTQDSNMHQSIKAIPLATRQELHSGRNNYKTLQTYKRQRNFEQ